MTALIEQELAASNVAEVIVVVEQPAPAAAIAGGPLAAAAMAATPAAFDVTSLYKYFVASELSQPGALAAAAATPAAAGHRGLDGGPPPPDPTEPRYFPNLGVILGTVTRESLEALRADPAVASVTGAPPISLIRPTRVAAGRATGSVTWGIQALRAPALWQQGLSGAGILVGHLDTGIDGRHPVFAGAIAHFAQMDTWGREIRPAPAPFDTEEHGTHTAATIAGRPVGGRHIGVAPGASLASAIVIEGGHVIARILAGMDWAIGHEVRILNMSLGLRGFFEDFLPVTRILRRRNILPVFVAGNEGPGTSRSPGNYAEALSVGAYARPGFMADFSSSQRFVRPEDPSVPDIVGPGVAIVSARPGGRYQKMDGTSMATPHIAGLAALLMEARPGRHVTEIEAAIFRSCRLKPGLPPERAGRGIPDAVEALALL